MSDGHMMECCLALPHVRYLFLIFYFLSTVTAAFPFSFMYFSNQDRKQHVIWL